MTAKPPWANLRTRQTGGQSSSPASLSGFLFMPQNQTVSGHLREITLKHFIILKTSQKLQPPSLSWPSSPLMDQHI